MSITKQQLKQLIREETQDVLKEFEPKQPDHQLSSAELAQRRARQAQMKATAAKKAAKLKLGDTRRPKRRRQDPPVSNYPSAKDVVAQAKAHQRAAPPLQQDAIGPAGQKLLDALPPLSAYLEDIEMYDAPVQGAETDRDLDRDMERLSKGGTPLDSTPGSVDIGPDLRKAALKTRPGMGPGAISDEEAKAKRPKRTRYNEANFTKQQFEQLIREELQLFLGEDMEAEMAAMEAEMDAGMDLGAEEDPEDMLASYASPQFKKFKAQFPKLALFPAGQPVRGTRYDESGPHGTWRGVVGDPKAPRWVQVQYKDWAQGIPYVLPSGLSGELEVRAAQYLQELKQAAGGAQP